MIHEKTLAQRKRLYSVLRREWVAGKTCARCGSRWNIECHHKNGRLGDLLLHQPLWIPLCTKCHQWVGDHPNEARAEGLLCEKGQWNSMPK